jgi:membrane-anchored protein YejM (alkaline phosphatase superfamily)
MTARPPPADSRRLLFRWLGWFGMANAVLLGVVGLLYLNRFSFPDSGLAVLYLFSVYVGHHVMLAIVPLMLFAGLAALIRPSHRLTTVLAVVSIAIVVGVYVLDGLLWSQSRFHINALTVQILGWQSWVFVVVIVVIALLFEGLLAQRVWQWVERRPARHGFWLGATSTALLITAWLIYAWADANYFVPVTSLAERLPVYKGFTAKRNLEKLGLVDLDRAREHQVARQASGDLAGASSQLMQYPLEPLACNNAQPSNLLIILLESWRFDMFDKQLMPELSAFASQRGQIFLNHSSGGNSSRSGAFSFFYGLPPGYWPSVKAVRQPAVFVEELQRQGYEMGIFSSGDLMSPVELDRSAFASVPELHVSKSMSVPPLDRDRAMVGAWKAWLDQRDATRPFFGFLFFDGTSSRVLPDEALSRFSVDDRPMAEEFAAYQYASNSVDSLVGDVLEDLESRGLLGETAILISGDHGEEFDDTGQGFDKHGSAFTRYQIRVPLITAWPGKPAAEYGHRTSHYDIAPTLLNDVLGCANSPDQVSVGGNLFDGQDWQWLVVGSYFNYAIMEPDRITITFPSGAYEIRDPDYRLLPDARPRADVLQDVISENTRFYAQ